jgi:hypothetical protein
VKIVVEHGYLMARPFGGIMYIITVIGVTETVRIGDNSNTSSNGFVFPVSSNWYLFPTSISLVVVDSNGISESKSYTVTKIGKHAFSNTGLTGVTIPEAVIEIGSEAFRNTFLTYLTFEETVDEDWNSNSALTTIGAKAFMNAFQGTSPITIKIPRTVANIGQGAFRDNPTLKQVALNGLSILGANAFKGMASSPRILVLNMEDLLALFYWRGPNEAKFSALDYSEVRFIPYFQGLMSNVCFPKGTPVITDQGPVNIDKLQLKDHTFGGEHIVAVTRTVTEDECLIRFDVGSLSPDVPTIPTVMSCAHSVLYEDNMVPATNLVSLEGVTKIPYNRGTPLFNVLLDIHSKMVINNMTAETLHPDNGMAKFTRALLATPDEGDRAEMMFNYNMRAMELGVFKNIRHRL